MWLTFNSGDPSVIRRLGGDPGGVFVGYGGVLFILRSD